MVEEKEETTTTIKRSGMKRDKKCPNCGRVYGLTHSLSRHKKLCDEKVTAMKKHPERYKGSIKV